MVKLVDLPIAVGSLEEGGSRHQTDACIKLPPGHATRVDTCLHVSMHVSGSGRCMLKTKGLFTDIDSYVKNWINFYTFNDSLTHKKINNIISHEKTICEPLPETPILQILYEL